MDMQCDVFGGLSATTALLLKGKDENLQEHTSYEEVSIPVTGLWRS